MLTHLAYGTGLNLEACKLPAKAPTQGIDGIDMHALFKALNKACESGDWAKHLPPVTSGQAINFYKAKEGNALSSTLVDPAAFEDIVCSGNLPKAKKKQIINMLKKILGQKCPTPTHLTANAVTPVPEPATLFLVVLGLLCFGLLKKKQA